jgi:FkbM family methyltransferase
MDNIYSNSELVSKFINLQKIIKPNVSIEVGAHAAEFSNAMAKAGIRAYAFEASPYVYEKFKDNVHPGVKYINKAVSYQDDIVMFQIDTRFDPKDTGHNTIMKRAEDIDYEYVKVEAVALDDFAGMDSNIALWIDCEGANREVLTGAFDVLQNVSSIFIEVEEIEFWKNQWLYKDVSDYLLEKGFVLWARDQEYGNHQYNCIFIKKELKSTEL